MMLDLDVRSVYGNLLIYPANRTAELLAEFTGQKTLAPRHVALAGELAREAGVGLSVSYRGAEAEVFQIRAAVESNRRS